MESQSSMVSTNYGLPRMKIDDLLHLNQFTKTSVVMRIVTTKAYTLVSSSREEITINEFNLFLHCYYRCLASRYTQRILNFDLKLGLYRRVPMR